MSEEEKSLPKAILRRWIRDFADERERYVPQELARPSRLIEGIELRPDGTYRDIRGGADDALIEAHGTWEVDEGGLLILHPLPREGERTRDRMLRIVEVDAKQLVVEEE